jgi:hypothetical protein
MKIVKYSHACVRVERDGAVLVIKPRHALALHDGLPSGADYARRQSGTAA